MDMQDIADQISTAVNEAEAGITGQGNDDGNGKAEEEAGNKGEGNSPDEDGTPEPEEIDTLPEAEEPKPDNGKEKPEGEDQPAADKGQEQPWIKDAKKLYGELPPEKLGENLYNSYQEIMKRDQARDLEIKQITNTLQNEWAKDPLFQEFIAVKYGGKPPNTGLDVPNAPDNGVDDTSLIQLDELPRPVRETLNMVPQLQNTIKTLQEKADSLEQKVSKYEDERLTNASEDLIDDMCSKYEPFKQWIDTAEKAQAEAKARGQEEPPLPEGLRKCFDMVKTRGLSLEEAFTLVTKEQVVQTTRQRTIQEMKNKGKNPIFLKGGGTAPSPIESGTLQDRVRSVVSGVLG